MMVNDDEQFFRVARMHSELTGIDSQLESIERRRAVGVAVTRLEMSLPIEAEDRTALEDEASELRARAAELQHERTAVQWQMVPEFLTLAELEFSRLDSIIGSGGWADLPERCSDTLETVTRSFVDRLTNAVDQWNHVGETLTQFSSGLPVTDSQRSTHDADASADSIATRIGPNERGNYQGIEVGGRSVELVSRRREAEGFLAGLETRFHALMSEVRTQLQRQDDSSTEVELELSSAHERL
ncbi:hypothetical protein [Brevibacterium sp. FME17]|uniref:hypothetical protein n=1 Tax=Brevibacterium sp. FME17 TaxID=2742606 RepID=UPI001865AB73|nr:hypothetical protein [Brevibacterium sp. FME17]